MGLIPRPSNVPLDGPCNSVPDAEGYPAFPGWFPDMLLMTAMWKVRDGLRTGSGMSSHVKG